MNRYLAILLAVCVICVPQYASAASVSFGAGLDPDGGHVSGSGADSGSNTALSGRMGWSGTAVSFDNGWIIGGIAVLNGKVTRTNDPAMTDKSIRVTCNSATDTVVVTVIETGETFSGTGHVTIR